MKIKTFLSLIVLLYITSGNILLAQWQQVLVNTLSYSSMTATSSHLYASTNNIIISSDNGTNWFSSGLGGETYSLSANSNDVFAVATSNDPNFYRSTNNGLAWITYFLSAADGLMCSAAFGSNVFAGTVHYGIRRSTNSGVNWSSLNISGSVNCIAVLDTTVFAAKENSGIYRSTNNGDNWIPTSFPSIMVNCITINGSTVYAGTNDGVYISLNNGLNWSQTYLLNKRVRSIVFTGNSVFAGTDSSGVYYTGNNGTNWVQKNEGLTNLDVKVLLINGDYIFNGAGGAGIWRRPLSELIGLSNISEEVPSEYSLLQNYPNPFNPVTNIKFSIPKPGSVKLTVYDAAGKETAVLFSGNLSAGSYNYDFDASNIASGIYFYKLESEDFSLTKKMVLVK